MTRKVYTDSMETTTTQANVLAALTAALDDDGLTLVRDAEWANTGTVYATANLDPVGPVLRYDFQNGRVSFGPGSQPVAVWSTSGGTAPFVYPTPTDLVHRVAQVLAGR